jgi:xylulokinase
MKCFLGIDAGTSGVKVIVLSDEGKVMSIGYKECNLITPKPKWVEQDPNDWWEACKYAIRDAVHKSGCGSSIEAIGLSGQMLGSTCLDKNAEPIGNCMIWLDQRATEERDFLENTAGMDKLLDITANYPLTGYWAPKLMWFKKNRPAEFDKIKTVLFQRRNCFRRYGGMQSRVKEH